MPCPDRFSPTKVEGVSPQASDRQWVRYINLDLPAPMRQHLPIGEAAEGCMPLALRSLLRAIPSSATSVRMGSGVVTSKIL
jgi:hypothetical protein